MSGISVAHSNVTKIKKDAPPLQNEDLLAVEEPLEIKVGYGDEFRRKEIPLSVTMRTPGSDEDLVMGFLVGEGIIKKKEEIISLRHCTSSLHPENTIKVELSSEVKLDEHGLKRNFVSSSSCGVCGKISLDQIKMDSDKYIKEPIQLKQDTIYKLSKALSKQQPVFQYTGGLHAAGIFSSAGQLMLIREDIGRHNAVDKVIGAAITEGMNLNNKILVLSGRIGYELMQKSIAASISIVAAIGAPSSLAVEMAKCSNTTLIGFLRDKSFNIYSKADNVHSN